MRKSDIEFSPDALAGVLSSRLRLAPGSVCKVAYSGGMDSHVLLHALASLRAAYPLRLSAIHVDHGLHPQSHQWSEHCRAQCAALEVDCVVEAVQVARGSGEGTEAAARRARYAALARRLARGDVLLTAHHQDDQAETLMLQLLRGAGIHGLAGMPWLADFAAGRHARPLLAFGRAELRRYADAQRLEWIDDPSNTDVSYRRNLLRHQVFPLLERHWPHAAGMLARSAQHAAEGVQLLDEIGASDLAHCRTHGTEAALSVPALLGLSRARQRNALRYWLRSQGFLAPSTQHLDLVAHQLLRPSRTGHARFTWPGAEVRRYRDQLHVMAPLAPADRGWEASWDPDRVAVIAVPGGRLTAAPISGRGISRARLAGQALRLRLRQGGEVCRLAGRAHHHKLKKLLQDYGVAPWRRERLPLVYAGNDLVAVADLWVCEPYVAAPDEPGWQLAWRLQPPDTAID